MEDLEKIVEIKALIQYTDSERNELVLKGDIYKVTLRRALFITDPKNTKGIKVAEIIEDAELVPASIPEVEINLDSPQKTELGLENPTVEAPQVNEIASGNVIDDSTKTEDEKVNPNSDYSADDTTLSAGPDMNVSTPEIEKNDEVKESTPQVEGIQPKKTEKIRNIAEKKVKKSSKAKSKRRKPKASKSKK